MKQPSNIKKQYFEEFRFCPRCGEGFGKNDMHKKPKAMFVCRQCGLRFFHNTKPAVSAMIPKLNAPENLLFTRRALEPGKNKLDFPGGFLEYHEPSEKGLIREIKEEIDLVIKIRSLFDAQIVYYEHDKVLHSVLTLYYLTQPVKNEPKKMKDHENYSCTFQNVRAILKNKHGFAFTSDIKATQKYISFIHYEK